MNSIRRFLLAGTALTSIPAGSIALAPAESVANDTTWHWRDASSKCQSTCDVTRYDCPCGKISVPVNVAG
jgi:hypothetical protein